MSDFTRIRPAITLKRVPKNGIASSDDFNNFMEQSVHDFALLFETINNIALPIFDGLGLPGTYTDVNPVANGLDGTTMMTDKDWSVTSSPYYWESTKNRPKTVYETFAQVVTDLTDIYSQINIVNSRLGTNDLDNNTNTATLAELETSVNSLTSIVYTVQTNNDEYLTAAEIATGINDQTINPASFHIGNADVENSAGIDPTKVSGIDLTTAYTYGTYPPATFDVRDSILRIKEWIEDLTGETFSDWTDDNVTSGTLKGHIATSGTGTVTSNNPHGLDVRDLSDGDNLLDKPQTVADFEFRTSGLTSYTGGYVYIPDSYTLTSYAVTLGTPGTSGITAKLYKRTSGGSTVLVNSGLTVGTTPTPGSNSVVLAGQTVSAGDMLFISGISGDGLDARAFVFGK